MDPENASVRVLHPFPHHVEQIDAAVAESPRSIDAVVTELGWLVGLATLKSLAHARILINSPKCPKNDGLDGGARWIRTSGTVSLELRDGLLTVY
jgi:hypothetical protein